MASEAAPSQVSVNAIRPDAVGEVENEPEVPDETLLDFCAQLDDYTPTVNTVPTHY